MTCPQYHYCLKWRDVTAGGGYTELPCDFHPASLKALTEDSSAKWYARLSLAGLTQGHTYEACGIQQKYFAGSWDNNEGSLSCASTKIDNTAPGTSLTIDDGDQWTTNPNLKLTIGYSDSFNTTAFGLFRCAGDTGCGGFSDFTSDPGCLSLFVSTMVCQRVYDGSDGLQRQCVVLTDAALPDNQAIGVSEDGYTFHDQFIYNGQPSAGNHSGIACDTINVDTHGPVIDASAATATVGSPTQFSASSTDAGIGPDSGFSWDFGDGSSGSGVAPTHTYAAAGTYTAKVTNVDQLANSSTKDVPVTVAEPAPPPPSDGGGSTTTPPPPPPPPVQQQRLKIGLAAPASLSVKASKKGVINLAKTSVDCPAGAGSCRLVATLAAGQTKLGSLSLTFAGGKAGVVKQFALSKSGLKALRKAKKLKATLTLTATGSGATKATRTIKLTIKAAR
jgi:hypothetical protein